MSTMGHVMEVEELLEEYWNEYVQLLHEIEGMPYFNARHEMINEEMAMLMHSIQGRLAIIKEHINE